MMSLSEPDSPRHAGKWSRPLVLTVWTSKLLAASTFSAGCSDFKPGTDTLSSNGSTLALLDPEWGCLAATETPATLPVSARSVGRVVYSIQVIDLSTGQVYADARVRACGVADINCENPVSDSLPVDADGWVDVPLFRDFTGFLEVTSSAAVPYLFYLNEPLAESTIEYPLTLVSLASLGPLVQLVGVQPQQETGVVAIRSFDCLGNTASGVSLVSNNPGTPWYFVDGLPSGGVSQTSAEGLGGMVNVAPGLAVVDVRAPTGLSIGGPQSVVVRANWLSVVYVRPRTGQRRAP